MAVITKSYFKSVMPVNVDEITAAELLQLFFDFYTDNLIWSLFLTSTAVHAVVLIASPLYVFQCFFLDSLVADKIFS